MPCYHPFRLDTPDRANLVVACNRCIGCRIDRSRAWASRCVQEASRHELSAFVTLTYDDAHLPKHQRLKLRDFQKFMKRLRRKIAPRRVSFFASGEYGDQLGRPHYHALLFGWCPQDKVFFKRADTGDLYTSAELSKLWPLGFASVGAVTFASAAYVARYCIKKVNGEESIGWYGVLDEATGELHERPPEFMTCSKRPGIGKAWAEQFGDETLRDDFMIIEGRRVMIPEYYEKVLKHSHAAQLELAKARRRKARLAARSIRESRPERRKVREEVKRAQVAKLKRTLK